MTKRNRKAAAAEKLAAEKLAAAIARHNRYADIEIQLSTMDRDANPALVCDLEIELAWLAEKIQEDA